MSTTDYTVLATYEGSGAIWCTVTTKAAASFKLKIWNAAGALDPATVGAGLHIIALGIQA
jgi:hypothetical protein